MLEFIVFGLALTLYSIALGGDPNFYFSLYFLQIVLNFAFGP